MAGTPEEDLLGWLEREEERLGFTDVTNALSDISAARDLFYEELGYDLTDAQFDALKDAQFLRYEGLPSISVSYEYTREYRNKLGQFTTEEKAWSVRDVFVYRDMISGRTVSGEDAFSLLTTIR